VHTGGGPFHDDRTTIRVKGCQGDAGRTAAIDHCIVGCVAVGRVRRNRIPGLQPCGDIVVAETNRRVFATQALESDVERSPLRKGALRSPATSIE
jgi:hypothetical protein